MGFFIIWIILAFVCANAGAGKGIGYWGCFWCCLLLSPLIGLIIGLVSKPVVISTTCKYCGQIRVGQIYYCQRCGKDVEGFTMEENKVRFKDPIKIEAPIVIKEKYKWLGWYVLGAVAMALFILYLVNH